MLVKFVSHLKARFINSIKRIYKASFISIHNDVSRLLNPNLLLCLQRYVKYFRHLETYTWSFGFEKMPNWLVKDVLLRSY